MYALSFFDQYADFILKIVHAGLYSIVIDAMNTYLIEKIRPVRAPCNAACRARGASHPCRRCLPMAIQAVWSRKSPTRCLRRNKAMPQTIHGVEFISGMLGIEFPSPWLSRWRIGMPQTGCEAGFRQSLISRFAKRLQHAKT